MISNEQEIIAAVDKGNVNTMNDALFKFVLGKDDAKRLTINFLNAVVGPNLLNPIEDLTFLQTEDYPERVMGRETRFDAACRLNSGERINVIVQMPGRNNTRQQVLRRWTDMYSILMFSQAFQSTYRSSSPLFMVNILDFVLFEEDPNPYSSWGIQNIVTHQRCPVGTDLALFFLEIPKYEGLPRSGSNLSPIERWMCYFSPRIPLQEKNTLLSDEVMQETLNRTKHFFNNEIERRRYIDAEIARMNDESALKGGL